MFKKLTNANSDHNYYVTGEQCFECTFWIQFYFLSRTGWMEDGDARPTQHRLGELTRQGSKSTLCRRVCLILFMAYPDYYIITDFYTCHAVFQLQELLLNGTLNNCISPNVGRYYGLVTGPPPPPAMEATMGAMEAAATERF